MPSSAPEKLAALRKSFLLALLAICSTSCGGGGGNPTPPTITSQPQNVAAALGAQKGPLIKGSTVTAQELDASLTPTGKQYSFQTDSDLGTFSPTSAFTSQYIGVNATGYYFDELANAVSSDALEC